MNITEYQIATRRTAKAGMSFESRLKHAALGCASDMGEVASLLKARLVYSKMIEPSDLIKELGDVTWFIAYACDQFNITMSEVAFHPEYDFRFMSYHNRDKDVIYWAMMGLKAAGDFSDLIANGCQAFTHRTIALNHLAKLYICVCQVADKFRIGISEVFDKNIEKLRKRYPDGYSDGAAIVRADTVVDNNTLEDFVKACPKNGLMCPECRKAGLEEPQVDSPGGTTCKFGHGGVVGVAPQGYMEDGTYGGYGDVYRDGGLPTRE